jgi:hypothetical protein
MIDPLALEVACGRKGVDQDAVFAGLLDLRRRGLVQLQAAEPSVVVLLAITDRGVLDHLERSGCDLASRRERLAEAATSAAGQGPVPLADQLGEPALLVEVLLEQWAHERRVVYSKAPGRRFRIHKILRVPS